MGLKDIGSSLPPGFRFFPSDEELVCHYLYKMIANDEVLNSNTLVDIDLHTCEPWELPDVAKLNASEWFFFSFRDRKYATGFRTNRATKSGYWKATGKDRMVLDPTTKQIVGMRKTLVFYMNRAPNGIKTGWVMHEFRLETPNTLPKEDWVLCRVFHKGKEENSNKLNQQLIFETSSNAPSLNLSASPLRNKILPCMYQQVTSYLSTSIHHQLCNNQNSYPNFVQNINTNCLTEINSDEYSFLWDMNLDENASGLEVQGVPSNMDEM